MSDMELLPRTHSDFARKEYWDEFFTKRQEKAFEWYGQYANMRPVLKTIVKPSDRILVVGCGNSDLSPLWANDGYKNMVSMDFSELVIKEMKQKHPKMQWDVMDMTNMTYANESFECIMDKGALDALMATDEASVLASASKMFQEVDRTLSVNGTYICVTMAQDFIIKHILTTFCETFPHYKVTAIDVPKDAGNKSPFVPFFILCTKVAPSSPALAMIRYNGKSFLDNNAEARKKWLLHELEATQWYSMSQLELKKIVVGRQRVIELMTSATTGLNTTPRYTIRLVDVHTQGPNGTCGVFLVPQGREHEYLFATEEGAMELASGAGFSRFLIVSLGRTHTFESLEAVQLELNPKIMELSPDTLGASEKIPYMTVQEGLGTRNIVAQGTSALSGDYFIEEVDMHRRLIFLSNSNTIQTEILLLPPLTAKQLKAKKKKQGGRVRFDTNYLAFEYHKSIVALLKMYLELKKPAAKHQSLLVGLGGGALASYIQATMSNVAVTAIELDPEIVEIATKHFGLQTNSNLQVVVDDGLAVLRSAAPESYGSIVIDVDAKSSHEKTAGITCPPLEFVSEASIQAMHKALNSNGVLFMNVSCRSSAMYKDVIAKLRAVFKAPILELRASEQDVNRIVCVSNASLDLSSWRQPLISGTAPTLPGFDTDELADLVGLMDLAE
ncbi:methyltransferase [Thraustotheca clavata]|uniref:Methyltransferase n=1 Tax=Thraustotheca clavata TaxID=74557 RepID=A0A1V9ZQ88_9STRA|nr:methyltransferase [Thraustotheca clavata]